MKIDRAGNLLVIEVGEKGTEERSGLFYALSGIPFAGWIDKTTITYDTAVFLEETTAKHLYRIEVSAKENGLQITDSARELFDEFARKLQEIQNARRQAEELEKAKSRAECKMTRGCCWCDELEWIDGKPYCKYAKEKCVIDNVEMERLYEEWKLTKVYQRPTPFPVKGCKHLEKLKEQV